MSRHVTLCYVTFPLCCVALSRAGILLHAVCYIMLYWNYSCVALRCLVLCCVVLRLALQCYVFVLLCCFEPRSCFVVYVLLL